MFHAFRNPFFGSNTSPSEFEPLARVRALLAEVYSRDEHLLEKHRAILDAVKFSTPPTSTTKFTGAVNDAFNPHYLKFTNPDRHDYLVDLKIKARLSPSPGNVHKLLSVKVCTWFASVESIHLTRSSFTFQDGPIATNFITCDPFHKWLHAQTDTI